MTKYVCYKWGCDFWCLDEKEYENHIEEHAQETGSGKGDKVFTPETSRAINGGDKEPRPASHKSLCFCKQCIAMTSDEAIIDEVVEHIAPKLKLMEQGSGEATIGNKTYLIIPEEGDFIGFTKEAIILAIQKAREDEKAKMLKKAESLIDQAEMVWIPSKRGYFIRESNWLKLNREFTELEQQG